jgi:hypothetical protein
MLTNSNSVDWNASPDLSISPNPNTTPDSDVVLSGELVLSIFYLFISKWHRKDQHYMSLMMLYGAFTQSPFLDFVQCL